MGYSINVVKNRPELSLGIIKIKEEKYLEAVQDDHLVGKFPYVSK